MAKNDESCSEYTQLSIAPPQSWRTYEIMECHSFCTGQFVTEMIQNYKWQPHGGTKNPEDRVHQSHSSSGDYECLYKM